MQMQARIETALTTALEPLHLDVVNESHMHSVAPGSETHFKVIVVSSRFEGRSLIDQQRLVNGALTAELRDGVHALAMKTMTPAQWERAGGKINYESPACRGGSKHDH